MTTRKDPQNPPTNNFANDVARVVHSRVDGATGAGFETVRGKTGVGGANTMFAVTRPRDQQNLPVHPSF